MTMTKAEITKESQEVFDCAKTLFINSAKDVEFEFEADSTGCTIQEMVVRDKRDILACGYFSFVTTISSDGDIQTVGTIEFAGMHVLMVMEGCNSQVTPIVTTTKKPNEADLQALFQAIKSYHWTKVVEQPSSFESGFGKLHDDVTIV